MYSAARVRCLVVERGSVAMCFRGKRWLVVYVVLAGWRVMCVVASAARRVWIGGMGGRCCCSLVLWVFCF